MRSRKLTGPHLVGGDLLMGFDREGTVDWVRPNDLRLMRHAEALTPIVRALLQM